MPHQAAAAEAAILDRPFASAPRSLIELEIRPPSKPTTSTRRRRQLKGRRFRALSCGWIHAPRGLLDLHHHSHPYVPVWIGLATTEASLGPFMANLLHRVPATEVNTESCALRLQEDTIYRNARHNRGGVVHHVLWHPLLEFEPPPDDDGPIRFLIRLKRSWMVQQNHDEKRLLVEALAQYLGRRTRLPIPVEPEFRQALYDRLDALDCLYPHRDFQIVGQPPSCVLLGCRIDRDRFEEVLQRLTTDQTKNN